ncbi:MULTISPECIES: DMT family transporter [Thiomicrorhabdus]|uniref:DMT family transporter n=1 Tax=Thiomicrorhabdus xiamenensis TaxID=2739063 RepID=A0A7D4NQ83_9GAMM|nr:MULTISPECIES: DMT family transporter [Thiomicrorhabdus]MBO1923757.1 DMT family transporter [Thiomicrorhabdus sp. 6S3-12]QKI88617.1 DMT family transporter [Thiomicrorhabdus xiamenensis]
MQSIAVFTLLGASILWGLTWLPLKFLHEQGFNGIAITFLVYVIMFAVTLPTIWRFRKQIAGNGLALLGILLLGGGAQLAFNTSMIFGDVIRVMVLFYLVPLWGVLGGRLFLSERITPFRWLGMGFSIIGAFFVVGGMNAFYAPPSWIDGLALLSGFLFAMNNIVFRASPKIPIMLKLNVMFLGAAGLSAVVLSQMGDEVIPQVSTGTWGILLAFAIFWMLLANLGTQWAVTQMEAGKSSIILILELVTAVVSASLILGETMSGLEMLGGALILIAALLETLPQKRKMQTHQNGEISAL